MPKPKLSNLTIAQTQAGDRTRQKLLPKLVARRKAPNRGIDVLQRGCSREKPAVATPEPATKQHRRRGRNKVGLAEMLARRCRARTR